MEYPDWWESTILVQINHLHPCWWESFHPPVVVHQSTHYTQDIHYNIPSDWVVHNSPLGYMYRGGWHKYMAQFSSMCWSSPLNPQVLLYDVHDSHFYHRQFNIFCKDNIHYFILKAGDSVHDQANYNVPNMNINNMVMQEWNLLETMEPSSFYRPTWIPSLLKHGIFQTIILNNHPAIFH